MDCTELRLWKQAVGLSGDFIPSGFFFPIHVFFFIPNS